MGRKKMKTRYRRFPAVSDWGGIKSAIGELLGIGYPRQPELNISALHAYCLHYQGKKCLICAQRCPAGAISEENAHDKDKCYQKVASSTRHCIKNYRIFIYGCGLCATRVPCESGIPKPLK